MNGFKFRRQVAIDRYVADFYCAEARLIVELDGDSHFEGDAAVNDEMRTAQLNRQGYEVVRFTNVDVFENLDGLLNSLLEICEERRLSSVGPSPRPPPPRTGERE